MLGLNCLIKDTRAVEDIKNGMSILAADRIQNDKSISFPALYKELRDAGLEVDAESAGSIYNELFGKIDSNDISSEEQIMEFAGKDVELEQKALVDAIEGVPAVTESQIGKLSPEKQVANNIAKMFRQAEFEGSKNVKSVMKQMESLVSKAAKTLLPPQKQKAAVTLHDSLNQFFDTESVQFRRLDGGMNTLETLHTAVKKEVNNYVEEVSAKLGDEEAAVLKEKWNTYVESFMKSAYDIMLGKSDQNKLLNEALKQVKVDGVQVVDVNGNIKWNSLMESGNPSTISTAVKKLFEDGIKDENGNEVKYTRAQAQRIGDYFEGLYKNKIAAVTQAKTGNNRSKNLSAKNIISDFVKDRGFVNLVKDKDGKLLLTQANWEKVLGEVKGKVGVQNGLDAIRPKLVEYLKKLTNDKGQPKLSDSQIDIVVKEFEQTVAAKLVPGTAVPHAMERLIALKNLNGGKSFQQGTESALNNVVGVSGLNQSTIDKIKELTQAAQDIISGNNVSELTNDDPLKNRGAYAFQALSQVERKIKEVIRINKMSRSQTQGVVKYISDNLGAASTSLLINPGNIGENILTGIASNFAESINTLFTNPKLYKQLGSAQKEFWTGLASHVSGGVANEVIAEGDMTADLQAGERLRLSAFANDIKKGKILSAFFKIPAYAASIISRTLMNSFDAGFNSALLRKKGVTSIYNALREQGYSGDETLKLMDESLNIKDEVNKELNEENARIKDILNKAGIFPTAADMAQNKLDLKLSLYENAISQGAKDKGLNVTPKQVREITQAVVKSAELQAKVVGGKKPIPISSSDILNSIIYTMSAGVLGFQRRAFENQQEYEKQGDLKRAAKSQMKAEVYKNTVGRFAGGIANFLALATTATPYGFVTARSLSQEKKKLVKNDPSAGDIYKAEHGDIRKYAEFHNLVKSMTVRATMGTLAIGGFIATKLLGDDDDDDGFVSNLMQTKSGRRLLQKYMPLGMNIAASALYDVEDEKLDTEMERLMEIVSAVTNKQYDSWAFLKTDMQRAEDDAERGMAISRFMGGATPTFNVNQGEQIVKFMKTIQSGFNPDAIGEVKDQEEKAKEVYKDIETWIDAFMVNGAIDAGRRTFSEDKKYNRFTE